MMSVFGKTSSLLRVLPAVAACRNITTSACMFGIKSRWVAPYRKELLKRQKKMERMGITHQLKRSEYIEWNYDAEVYAFGKRLGEQFDNNILREALTDSSYISQERVRQQELGVPEPALTMTSNNELATAGSHIIADYSIKYLRSALPLFPEEGIRSLVDYLTSSEVMAEVGLGIGLKDLILCKEYPPTPETVGKCFQAVVGALNASTSLSQCQLFVRDFVVTQLVGKDLNEIWEIENPMEAMQDILGRSGRGEPEPRLIFESGKNTLEAVYHVGIYSDKEFIGSGYGETIGTAVDQAARDALRRFFQTTAASPPLPFGKENVKLKAEPNLSVEDWSLEKAKNIITC
nr:39S ribosomal protein L44, mitochondrial-like [Penaeus vannamei]